MDTAPPPSNPFSSVGNVDDDDDDDDDDYIIDNVDNDDAPSKNDFDAFSLYPSSSAEGGGASSSVMPSLQSIQRQEQMMILRQQQEQQQQQPSFVSLPSPDDLSGPMNNNAAPGSTSNWPPPPAAATTSAAPAPLSTTTTSIHEPSFLSNILTCGIIPHLMPYFDVDTSDVYFRMKATFQYCLVNDGFRNEVLYSIVNTSNTTDGEEEGVELAHRSETDATTATKKAAASAETTTTSSSSSTSNNASSTIPPTTIIRKIGPDLYGPTWITLTLVFFVAVSSNMSLYIHHYHQRQIQLSNIVDEGGVAAEEEWDYDINQLLRATSILYSFSFGLPTVLYLLLRLMGGNSNNSANNLGLADLICLYGYSLVPYLPVTWMCILPYNWVQWSILGIATLVSGMLVLRNVVGSILESSRGGGGGLGGGGMQGKSGGLIMCLVGCHLVFFLVLKLSFYHHHTA